MSWMKIPDRSPPTCYNSSTDYWADLFDCSSPGKDGEDESPVNPPAEHTHSTEVPEEFDFLDETNLEGTADAYQEASLNEKNHEELPPQFGNPDYGLRNNEGPNAGFAYNPRLPRSGLPSPITTPDTSPNALNDASNNQQTAPTWGHLHQPNGLSQLLSLQESTTSRTTSTMNTLPNSQEYRSTRHSTLRAPWAQNHAGGDNGSADQRMTDHFGVVYHDPSTMAPHPGDLSMINYDDGLANSTPFINAGEARSFGSMGPPMLPRPNNFHEYASLLGDPSFIQPHNQQATNSYGEWNPQGMHNSEHSEFRQPIDYTAPYTAPGAPQEEIVAHNDDMRRPYRPQSGPRARTRRQRSTPNDLGDHFTNLASDQYASNQHPFPGDVEAPIKHDSGVVDTVHTNYGYQDRPDDDSDSTPSDGDFVYSPTPPAPVRRGSTRHRPGQRRRFDRDDFHAAVEDDQSPVPISDRQTSVPEETRDPSPSASPAPRTRKTKPDDPQIPRWAVPRSERQSSGEQRGVTGLKQPYIYESELRQIRRGYYQRPRVFQRKDPNGDKKLKERIRITPQEKERLMKIRPGWDIKKGPSKHHKTKEECTKLGLRYEEKLKKRAAIDAEKKKRKRDVDEEPGDREQNKKKPTQKGKRVQYEEEEDEEESEYQEDDDGEQDEDEDLYGA